MKLVERLVAWWKQDPYRAAVLAAGLAFAGLISYGLPFWDGDFTIYFQAIQGKSLARLFWMWISPISADTNNWGFLDRAVQFIVYKLTYAIAGYDSWPYLLLRVACYGGLGLVIYAWSRRLAPEDSRYRPAAAAAAIFFLVAPAPIAAMVWIADFAPIAEFALALLTYILWIEIEKTPADWIGFPDLKIPEQKRWLLRWVGLALAVYLSYKTKADLKIIPAVTAVYLALTRRRQWKLFAAPIGLMVLLAVPWNGSLFRKLPPFVPGSAGATESFMWQPASLARVQEFIWSSNPYQMREGTLSLAGLLGPFLIVAAVAFLVWRPPAPSLARPTLDTPRGRAHLFVAIWFLAILAAASALPALPYFFRIRYGILTLVPASILLSSLFTWFADCRPALPKWAAAVCIVLFCAQTAVNFDRSMRYRRGLGQVEVAIDQAYDYITKHYPNDDLALMPDFLPFDYHLDACPAIRGRHRIGGANELALRHAPNTTVLSWQPQGAPLQQVALFSGCSPDNPFDKLSPCEPGSGAHVMRYTGSRPTGAFQIGYASPQQYLQRSYELCTAKRPKECIEMAKQALRLDPNLAEAYNNIAAAYEDLHLWNEAIQAAREAIRLKPDFQLAKNNLAWSESQKALGAAKK